MLTTDNLMYLAQSIPNFCGVYSINSLPKLPASNYSMNPEKKNYNSYIINLDTDNLSGSHWVAAVDTGQKIELFDSFGTPPEQLLQSWATKHSCEWTYEPYVMIQHLDAVTCGYYALIYCLTRPLCKNMKDALNIISNLNI